MARASALAVCAAALVLAAAELRPAGADESVAGLVRRVYGECLSRYSVECVRPRALEWAARAAGADVIAVTDELRLVRTVAAEEEDTPRTAADGDEYEPISALERFLETHALHVRVPAALRGGGEAAALVPRALLRDLPAELTVPLAEDAGDAVDTEGRSKIKHKIVKKFRRHGFIKKVVIPFLLGLKFKASVLVPLALAMIALKTWKALTLGLISLVLSGAMVIFKFTKPKVVNYEVIHYPQHHVEHHVDHHAEHAPAAGWDAHAHVHAPYQARALSADTDTDTDAHRLAYSAQAARLL